MDCKESQILLTPTFPLHLLGMLVMFSVVTVMDILLKLVFISCSLAVRYCTVAVFPEVKTVRYVAKKNTGVCTSVSINMLQEYCVVVATF